MKEAVKAYLYKKVGKHVVKNAINLADTAWSILCLISVPALMAFAIAMAMQKPGVTSVDQANGTPTVIVNRYSPPAYVESPITLSSEIRKAQYDTYIANGEGEVVYHFPVMTTDNPGQRVSFRLPALPEGTYYVRSHIIYALNPLKNSNLDVEMARVIVQNVRP